MNSEHQEFSRRVFVQGITGAGLALAGAPWLGAGSAAAAQPEIVPSMVIDLGGNLESIHPSLAYSGRDWSIVQSIYDSIVTIREDGHIVPLAAESFSTGDAQSFQVRLRPGLRFHDDTPVTAEVLRGSWQFLMASGSKAVDVFRVISDIEVHGDLDATIVCDSPSPWLPAQIATWLMLVPPGYTDEQAVTAPIGTGPYRLPSYEPGSDVELMRFADYQLADVKGAALAEMATFRIVLDATTRVADVATGTANIAADIPLDFRQEVEDQGATLLDDPLVGSQWIRIAADAPPFDDVRVRKALNHAVDKATITGALLGPEVHPLGSILPDPRALGYVDSLEPYSYDPERARALLKAAGVEPDMKLGLEMTAAARKDVAEAIAANLGDVGFEVEVVASDLATFNAGWTDPERPVLRLTTWSPLYEPHTLLNLVFTSDGYLSRYSTQEVDRLVAKASVEPVRERRRELLEEVNMAMYDDPPVIFLWNLMATYGVDAIGKVWQPEGNEQIVPTGPAKAS